MVQMVRARIGRLSLVRQRTDPAPGAAYNGNHQGTINSIGQGENEMMNKPIRSCPARLSHLALLGALFGSVALLAACSSMKAPATADVAVSGAALDNALGAGAAQYAPLEVSSAREKIDKAKQAMQNKDYKLASELANSAQLDAQLAQSKANSAKAQATATTLQDDIRVLRAELERAGK
jgi:hypothetical protein